MAENFAAVDSSTAKRSKTMGSLRTRLNRKFDDFLFLYDANVDECLFIVTPRNNQHHVLAEVLVDMDRNGRLTGNITIAAKTTLSRGREAVKDLDFTGVEFDGQWYLVHEFAIDDLSVDNAADMIEEQFSSTRAYALR